MMRTSPRTTALRSTPLLLAALALLTTACGNSDPLAPRSTSAVRAPSGAPVHASGYMVSWGRDSSGTTNAASSGYVVSWGKDGNGDATNAPTSSGYAVSWGKDDGGQ